MDREQIELQLDRIWQNHKESRPRRASPPRGRGMARRSGNRTNRLRLDCGARARLARGHASSR